MCSVKAYTVEYMDMLAIAIVKLKVQAYLYVSVIGLPNVISDIFF